MTGEILNMNKNDEIKTRLVFESEDNRYLWESPYADASMDDILPAFYGLLVAATWQPETIIKCMKDFVEENEYVLEKNQDITDWPHKDESDPQPHFYA